MKLSCFSAVIPVIGWNQCVKWVTPFSTAHSFIALATMFATCGSRGSPCSRVRFRALYVSFGSLSFITLSLNTMLPKIPGIFRMLIKSHSLFYFKRFYQRLQMDMQGITGAPSV